MIANRFTGHFNTEFVSIYNISVQNNIHTKCVAIVIYYLLIFSKIHSLVINENMLFLRHVLDTALLHININQFIYLFLLCTPKELANCCHGYRVGEQEPKWYKFDDGEVSECKMDDDEEMKNQCFGGEYLGEVFDHMMKR